MWLSEEAVCCRGDTASGWRMKSRLFHPARLRGALRSSAGPNRWRGGENNRQVHTVTQMSLESRTALFIRKGRKVFSWNWAQSVQAGSSSATMWPLCCGTKSHQIWFWVWVLGVWFCHTGAFPLPWFTCLFINHHLHIHKFKKKMNPLRRQQKGLLDLQSVLRSSSFSKENYSNCSLRWTFLVDQIIIRWYLIAATWLNHSLSMMTTFTSSKTVSAHFCDCN